jgi:hypothetical protein
MTIVKLNLKLKKTETIDTRWSIIQKWPRPYIAGHGGSLQWSNYDGILRHHGSRPTGLEHSYRVDLMRSDQEEPDMKTMKGSAGYEGNPGSFDLRGSNLLAINATITQGQWAEWHVRGGDTPKPGELEFLNTNVLPAILKAIETDKEALKAEAIACLSEHITNHLSEMVDEIVKLRAQMELAIATL